MVKQIRKIGNSQGIIFDSTLMQMARLKVGDDVNLEIHDSGAITITPIADDHINESTAAETAKRLIGKNSELFRRLS
jgi:antitoxin component of MazEF toxin-antitoxin module